MSTPLTKAERIAKRQALLQRIAIAKADVADQVAAREEKDGAAVFPGPDASAAEVMVFCAKEQESAAAVEKRVTIAQNKCDRLLYPYRRACKMLFQVHRLEGYGAAAEVWAAQAADELDPPLASFSGEGDNGAEDDEASEEAERKETEAKAVAHIRALQKQRDAEIVLITAMQDRIAVSAAELKGVKQLERRNTAGGSLTAQAKNYERACATWDTEDADDETHTLRDTNDEMTAEANAIHRQGKEAQESKTLLQKQMATARAADKATTTHHKHARSALEQQLVADRRTVSELQRANAALTSTLEVLMQQLNMEHYGIGGAPQTRQETAQRQIAAADRAAGRSRGVSPQ